MQGLLFPGGTRGSEMNKERGILDEAIQDPSESLIEGGCEKNSVSKTKQDVSATPLAQKLLTNTGSSNASLRHSTLLEVQISFCMRFTPNQCLNKNF
jgi:hypothetical protein